MVSGVIRIGLREAIRVHTVARVAAVRARAEAINELKAIVVTADDHTRSELRNITANQIVDRCTKFRDCPTRPTDERCTRNALRAIARRHQHLNTEIAEHDTVLKPLVDTAAPQLVAEREIGYVTAAAFCLAWSETLWSRLC